MTKEKLFEFAAEKGWHEILQVAYGVHSLPDLATKINKKESMLQIELKAMQTVDLVHLIGAIKGKYRYAPTFLGIKFLQEQNKKAGRTYSCLLCGTTTGIPHVCPVFDARFR